MSAARAVYGSRSINRQRRSRAEIEALQEEIYTVLREENPMTVRQVFYQLVSRGAIEKTEAAYKCIVVRQLTVMRRRRLIPFGWISDNTRWMRKPRSYSSLRDALESGQRTYRRAIWNEQNCHVEIWLEKDALSGVLFQATQEWDVPLMVTRGYPSISYLYEAAEAMSANGKPAVIYYYGDHDPSGRDITRAVEKGLREFAPEIDITFARTAITLEQIEQYNLPTRPTKKTDSRSKHFEGESVEVDALPPAVLRDLVRADIERHIDEVQLRRTKVIEIAERESFDYVMKFAPEWDSDGEQLWIKEKPE